MFGILVLDPHLNSSQCLPSIPLLNPGDKGSWIQVCIISVSIANACIAYCQLLSNCQSPDVDHPLLPRLLITLARIRKRVKSLQIVQLRHAELQVNICSENNNKNNRRLTPQMSTEKTGFQNAGMSHLDFAKRPGCASFWTCTSHLSINIVT